jgi:hypothetical protein
MKIESWLFTGVSLFFLVDTVGYAWGSGQEPAGTAALAVACAMSAVIAFFLWQVRLRKGSRPEDDKDAEVIERAGPVDFFPARSPYPLVTAAGAVLCALGVVFGLWLFLLGLGTLASGAGGMVFQYVHRGEA